MFTNCNVCVQFRGVGTVCLGGHVPVETIGSCAEYRDFGPRSAGVKADAGKPRWDLLPFAALDDVAKVLEYGARKYAPDNWRKVEGWRWRYLGAALRHLAAFGRGENLDPESQLPHLAHAACCVLFLLELGRPPKSIDERVMARADHLLHPAPKP